MCGSTRPNCDCPTDQKVHGLLHELAGLPHIADSAISRRISEEDNG